MDIKSVIQLRNAQFVQEPIITPSVVVPLLKNVLTVEVQHLAVSRDCPKKKRKIIEKKTVTYPDAVNKKNKRIIS